MITAKQVYSEIVKMPVSERAKLFTLIATQGFKESNYSYDDVFGDLPETLSLKDAAEYLGVAEITVRRWIKDGKLSPSRLGRNYAFNVSDLRAFKKRLVQDWKLCEAKQIDIAPDAMYREIRLRGEWRLQ